MTEIINALRRHCVNTLLHPPDRGEEARGDLRILLLHVPLLAAIHLEMLKLHAGEVVVAEHFPAAVAQGQRGTGGLAAIAQADSAVGKLPKERIGAGQGFATQSRP